MTVEKKEILVVEDDRLNRAMLADILSRQYFVLTAENGLKALEVLRERKESVALILLDVMMPVMDGYGFLRRIREDPALSSIPVIVTTANGSEADELAALEQGAADFLPKPYRPQIILHKVARLIDLREKAAMAGQPRYDRLTGLCSKEAFCREARERICAHPERQYTLICSNVENFKLYNDIFGPPAGDRLLCDIAALFRSLTEDDDLCGRFEADRFVLLKSQTRRTDDYDRFAEAGQQALDGDKSVVLKWGVYEVTDGDVPVEKMCDRALLAADSIKGQYNVRCAVYDDALRDKLLREQIITESMETALREGQFQVYFQPKFSLPDDRLAGAEALVRWDHPTLGFLSPGEFIPLFERNGFITRLDTSVWERTCALLHRWTAQGMAVVPVSVNISRVDIFQADVADILLRLTQQYELDPRLLHLEITESAYTEHPEQIIAAVDKLRGLGFVIEMDDFGSGYSSLHMLDQMQLDVLKLDMKFIQSETAKSLENGILRFVVDLARRMDLRVVAEGVETREQLERIRELGCDYVQGFFFAKPMPSREFETYLSRGAR